MISLSFNATYRLVRLSEEKTEEKKNPKNFQVFFTITKRTSASGMKVQAARHCNDIKCCNIMPRIFRHSNSRCLPFWICLKDLGDDADRSRDAGHGLGEF